MKIAGTYGFAAPREVVWAALLDPDVLVRTMPGCERLTKVGDNRFEGALTVSIGPVKGQFAGTLELTSIDPLNGYHMKLDGAGPAGFMNGEGAISIASDGEKTILTYDIDAKVGGRVAGVGQRLLDSSARVITKQGLEGLERQLAAIMAARAARASALAGAVEAAAAVADGTPPGTTVAAGAPVELPPAPTQAQAAVRFATGMVEELVPEKQRRPLAIVAGVAAVGLLTLLVLALRSCGG
jgi:carbon monoxide dehydrogenase subunit G